MLLRRQEVGLWLLVLASMSSLVSCTRKKGDVVSFDALCADANEGKRLAVVGYFHETDGTMFSKNNEGLYSLDLQETPTGGNRVTAYFSKGSGANDLELPASQSFTLADVRVHGDDGTAYRSTDRIQLSGTVEFATGPFANNAPRFNGQRACWLKKVRVDPAP